MSTDRYRPLPPKLIQPGDEVWACEDGGVTFGWHAVRSVRKARNAVNGTHYVITYEGITGSRRVQPTSRLPVRNPS